MTNIVARGIDIEKHLTYWHLAGYIIEDSPTFETNQRFISIRKGNFEVDFWFTHNMSDLKYCHTYIIRTNDRDDNYIGVNDGPKMSLENILKVIESDIPEDVTEDDIMEIIHSENT